MSKPSKNYPLGSSSSDHKPSSRKITLATFLLKQRLPATLPVAIVQEKGRVRIWTLTSSAKLSMRLVDTDLEVLASTFLVNRSYIRGFLMLSATSSKGVRATLSCSPQMGQKSMTASQTLYPPGLTRLTGLGDQRQSLESPPY